MTDGQFGVAVAFGFLLFGGFMAFFPHRMLASVHRYNDNIIWMRIPAVQMFVRPKVYIPVMRAMGVVAMVIAFALFIGLWLTRSQR